MAMPPYALPDTPNAPDQRRVERNRIAISLRSRLLHLVVGQFH
jgi:hypothetical protein